MSQPIFEVGEEYEFTFLTATEDGLSEVSGRRWVVQAYEGTLLRLHSPASPSGPADEFLGPTFEENMILNTASPFFHSARLTREIEAREQRMSDLAEKWRTGKQGQSES